MADPKREAGSGSGGLPTNLERSRHESTETSSSRTRSSRVLRHHSEPTSLVRSSVVTAQTVSPQSEFSNGATSGHHSIKEEPNTVRVKGINFITFLEAIAKYHGLVVRQRLEKEVPGDFGNALRFGGIVAGGWYEIGWYRTLLGLITERLTLDDVGIRRLSYKATAISVSVVYRTLAKVTTPTMLVNLSARIFGYYFDKGQLTVLKSERGHAVVEWTRCNGFDTNVWKHVVGGTLYFLEAAGAKAIEPTLLGGGRDANWLRAGFTYR